MRSKLITPIALLAALALNTDLHAQTFRVKRIQRDQYVYDQHRTNMSVMKTDSIVFYYAGNKGGQLTWQWAERLSPSNLYEQNPLFQYDSLVAKSEQPFWSFSDEGVYRGVQKFNAGGQLTDYTLELSQNGTTIQKGSKTFTYSGSILATSTSFSEKSVYTYQSGILQKTEVYQTTPMKLKETFYYSYDAGGNLVKIMSAKPTVVKDSTWILYSYDMQNHLIEQMRIGPDWNGIRDTMSVLQYSYNSNGDVVQTDNYSGWAALQLSTRYMSSYDNQHRKTEEITFYKTWPNYTLDTQRRSSFTYDNYGLLTKLEKQHWYNGQWISHPDSTNFTADDIYTFEYETAWPTSVPEVENAAIVKLYPSPASDFIRIETEWKNVQPFTAALLDMQGRVVRQWDEPATKNYARTIPLTELPSGMYVIKLNSGEEQYSKQFSVYK